MEAFLNWIRENKGLFIGICAGLTAAILFLALGFWPTLLIAVCVGAGALLGAHPQIFEIFSNWFDSLFKKE